MLFFVVTSYVSQVTHAFLGMLQFWFILIKFLEYTVRVLILAQPNFSGNIVGRHIFVFMN